MELRGFEQWNVCYLRPHLIRVTLPFRWQFPILCFQTQATPASPRTVSNRSRLCTRCFHRSAASALCTFESSRSRCGLALRLPHRQARARLHACRGICVKNKCT